ncbi:putative acetyltransferase [Natranaerovirga hydrolytica]|uniref:Putative acetyltransferase n=1 Tax=Natranaerovirga hydrolytica TaxID=680378 RepID=A0A4V2Q1T2_9FIRM|nr:GNAT family N-acetyltransferase [Natranaerovirga hydrolytica]TCK98831.1 putative acetyltransferase [Natranaerovirga hydrolytica]
MPMVLATDTDTTELMKMWQDIFGDSKSFTKYYYDVKAIDNEILLNKKEDIIISMIHLNPYNMLINHQNETVDYIVGVATKPEYEGQGYMKATMLESLYRLYNKGHSFTLLMPIDERIYTRFDFSFIYNRYEVYINNKELINYKCRSYEGKAIKIDAVDEMRTFFKHYMEQNYKTYVKRDHRLWQNIYCEIDSEKGEMVAFYNESNQMAGYIIYHNLEDICEVREMMYSDYNVLKHILTYISDTSIAEKIKINAHHLEINHFIPYGKDTKIVFKPYIMGRVIQVEKFLRLFNLPVAFKIRIIDPIIKENTGIYKCNQGLTEIERTNEKPDIEMTVDTLMEWLMGYTDLKTLYDLDKVKVYNIDSYNLLENKMIQNKMYFNEIV